MLLNAAPVHPPSNRILEPPPSLSVSRPLLSVSNGDMEQFHQGKLGKVITSSCQGWVVGCQCRDKRHRKELLSKGREPLVHENRLFDPQSSYRLVFQYLFEAFLFYF